MLAGDVGSLIDGDRLLLRDTIRRFADERIRPVAHDLERSGAYPDVIVEGMRELGLFGLTVPREYGGAAADALSIAIVFEELSRAWMGIAGILGTHTLACRLIARHGTNEQKERYLPGLADGARRSGLGLTEAGGGTDLQAIRSRASLQGDSYVINGTKTWITNARNADPLPVLVKTDPDADPPHRGMSIILVDRGTPGFVVQRDLGKLGYHGPETCEVAFDDVRVPAENLLGHEEGRGMQQALGALELGRVNVAARAVGVAQESLQLARDYALERTTFGKPIAQHQAIQIKLAQMAMRVQSARLMTWWAAAALDSNARADAETAMAKHEASEAAAANSLDAMRIHGGIGYSTELDVERLYRDAPLMIIGEGTNEMMQVLIAKRLIATGCEWL